MQECFNYRALHNVNVRRLCPDVCEFGAIPGIRAEKSRLRPGLQVGTAAGLVAPVGTEVVSCWPVAAASVAPGTVAEVQEPAQAGQRQHRVPALPAGMPVAVPEAYRAG